MTKNTAGQFPRFSRQDASGAQITLEDAPARAFAVDPVNNVVLEASAGTGKTTVLVSRYVNLLRAGVDPSNILAITFTRQAATEMRDRIIRELRAAAEHSRADQLRWRDLRDRLGEIAISTIDAFCLALLREFPLEADLDPAFGVADETEASRLVQQALDRTLAVCGVVAAEDVNVAMVLAQLGPGRVRTGLAHLLERRLVAPGGLQTFLSSGPRGLTASSACRRAAAELAEVMTHVDGGLGRFVADGPLEHPRFALLSEELRRLDRLADQHSDNIRPVLDRIREYFLTLEGKPRKRLTGVTVQHCRTVEDWRRHRTAATAIAPDVAKVLARFDRDLNWVLARGAQRMFAIAVTEYERELADRSLLDFSGLLQRALDLLRRMDEFAQSRYRLESRYHHVLVDEFQDTSRAQWELVSLLVQSWGEGFGLVHDAPVPPSVFVVGDRKQSIYGFRDADVGVLHDAGAYIETLRATGDVRRSISHSFRAVPALLSFVNDLFGTMEKAERPRDGFCYEASDRFPVAAEASGPHDLGAGDAVSPLGLVLGDNLEDSASRVAGEVSRLLKVGTVRDQTTGVSRRVSPGDVAILFRARETHREFQAALEALGIPAFVYKGLGFFDTDEVKDYRALLRFLASPRSDLRAAALLRSRLVRVSDAALVELAGDLSATLLADEPPLSVDRLEPVDRALVIRLRDSIREWITVADRVPPAELIDRVYADCAYAFELRGPRLVQARENLKKMRGLVRRVQNRGFATLSRIADHVDRLSGDVSNAVVDAFDAVNLMTVHAAKGLEFPVVFLVELARGTGGARPAIRVVGDGGDGVPSVSIAPFRSAVDDDQRARDREETKRLLYVATTRARDRLYLGATRTDGEVRVGSGSLAAVLPDSLSADLFATSGDVGEARWAVDRARGHLFHRVGRAPAADTCPVAAEGSLAADGDLLGSWHPVPALPRARVTEIVDASRAEISEPGRFSSGSGVGSVVHRLLQYTAESGHAADVDIEGRIVNLMTDDERGRADCAQLVNQVAAVFRRALLREEVLALIDGDSVFEFPFSVRRDDVDGAHDVVVRGTIDCLQRWPDGRLTVVEIKTGSAQPHHEQQLDVYVGAARALFPEVAVDGTVVYL